VIQLHWAEKARSGDERSAFLQMPKTWYEAAIALESSLGLKRESREPIERSQKHKQGKR
jgi:hypothetical protein